MPKNAEEQRIMTEINNSTVIKRTDAKEYIGSYWSDRAEGFAKLREKELHSDKLFMWQKEILSKISSNCEITSDGNKKKMLKILDIGCGTGFFSIMLSKNGFDVCGIDLTREMIEMAEELAQREKCSVVFKVMDAESLQFDDEIFDVVIARNVTWNLTNPEGAYEEWLRVLKVGGLLLNYDAEYAKDHHKQKLHKHNAHEEVTDELMERCHRIYHMLDVSLYNRPNWDMKLLTELEAECQVDLEVGKRIYKEEDIFFIPVPMFGIYAIKKKK